MKITLRHEITVYGTVHLEENPSPLTDCAYCVVSSWGWCNGVWRYPPTPAVGAVRGAGRRGGDSRAKNASGASPLARCWIKQCQWYIQ